MQKSNKYIALHIICWLLLILATLSSQAQTSSGKQEVGRTAPVNLKIDGRLGEWGDLLAYSTNVRLQYTIANDNDNLYLANEHQISRKLKR